MGGIARGSTANLGGAVVFGVTNFAITLLVTHRLSRAEAGVFFSATSLFLLSTTLGMLGTNTGLVYFISRCRALGRRSEIRGYFRAGSIPVVAVGCAMGVVLFVFAPQIAKWTNADHVEVATIYLRLMAGFIPFAGIENVTLAATRGAGTMRANVVVEQIGRSLLQVLFVGLALLAPTTWGLSVAWALPYLPASIVAYFWWRRLSCRLHNSATSAAAAKLAAGNEVATRLKEQTRGNEFWRFTAPRAVASVGQIAMQRMDIVLVAALSGAVQAAIYTAATRFLVIGQMGNRAISMAVQPRLAEALARGHHNAARRLYQVSTAWLVVITWPLYLTLIVFGNTLLRIFGHGYSGGTAVVMILAFSMLWATSCGMVDIILTMAGRTSWNLANVLAGLGVNLGLDLWLIPSHGVVGAAIGWAAAIALQNLLALCQTGFILHLHPFGKTSLVAAGLNIVSFGMAALFWRWALGNNWLALSSATATGGSLYFIGLRHCRKALELSALRGIRRVRGSRLGPGSELVR